MATMKMPCAVGSGVQTSFYSEIPPNDGAHSYTIETENIVVNAYDNNGNYVYNTSVLKNGTLLTYQTSTYVSVSYSGGKLTVNTTAGFWGNTLTIAGEGLDTMVRT